jgi:hypothetical protein
MATAAPSIPQAEALTATNPLTLWHLLSLDAPTVATLWTWFIARTTGTRLPPALLSATFLAVWILYALDRLLDARALRDLHRFVAAPALNPSSDLQPRHLFHYRHRRAFAFGILSAVAILVPALTSIPAATFHLYLALATLLLLWLGFVHTRSVNLPKELVVGLFFAAATVIPSRSPSLILPALFFANLCSLNCLHIYAWEHTRRQALRPPPPPHTPPPPPSPSSSASRSPSSQPSPPSPCCLSQPRRPVRF